MNYKGEIQYVRYYTAGSAAQKIETRSDRKAHSAKAARTAAAPEKRVTVQVDPFALIGTAIAAVMLICVLVGFFRVNQANQQVADLERYVSTLQAENAALQVEYEQGYDLDEVRIAAASMGLVPIEQVQHIRVAIQEPAEIPEPGFWEGLWLEIQELFA